jgi:2,4-dienoyl-CoA reductase (NADPH2)
LRRHEVTLYDGGHRLGGVVPLAAVVKGDNEDLDGLVRYYSAQLNKLGVGIRLGEEVTPSVVKKNRPDVLILATGGIYTVPGVLGKDKPNVVNMADLNRKLKRYLRFVSPRILRQLTSIWMPIGRKVVIMGGRIQGLQLAGFLAERGRQVTIVDTGLESELGEGMVGAKKGHLLGQLAQKGVKLISEAEYEEITHRGLVIVTKEGMRQSIEADTILPAMPLRPDTEFLRELKGEVAEIYSVGSCSKHGLIVDAIADGSRIGRVI